MCSHPVDVLGAVGVGPLGETPCPGPGLVRAACRSGCVLVGKPLTCVEDQLV